MLETNKKVELNDDELDKITGGAGIPKDVEPLFHKKDKVRDNRGWEFIVIDVNDYHNETIYYKLRITKISSYTEYYTVGDEYRLPETLLTKIG